MYHNVLKELKTNSLVMITLVIFNMLNIVIWLTHKYIRVGKFRKSYSFFCFHPIFILIIRCLPVHCLRNVWGIFYYIYKHFFCTAMWLLLTLQWKYFWLLHNQYENIWHARLSSEVFSLFLLASRCVKHSMLWMHHFRHLFLNKCVVNKHYLYYANNPVIYILIITEGEAKS